MCTATGVKCGSVYHHFGSRERVIDAAYGYLNRGVIDDELAFLAEFTCPELGTVLAREQDRLHDAMERFFEQLQAQGRLRDDATPRSLAVFVVALLFGRVLDDVSVHPLHVGERRGIVELVSGAFGNTH